MKSLLLLLLTVLCFCSCRKDLVHWKLVQKIETHTTTDRLNKIFFVSDSIGFITGGQRFLQSALLTTRDGGLTWSYRNIVEAPKALNGMTMTAAGTLYIVGFDGKLLRSDDTGKSWQFFQLDYFPYKDLAFFDESRGLAIGGVSFNQGYKINLDGSGGMSGHDSLGYEFNDIEMIDGRSGYLSAYGGVLKTGDSGRTWVWQNIANDNFSSIHSYGVYEAWTCGSNGSIFHTSDGGLSWERMRNGNDLTKPGYRLCDILFSGPLNGYAVGEDGLFIFSDDGGRHWMEADRFTGETLRNIHRLANGDLLVCGDGGSLYRLAPKGFQ